MSSFLILCQNVFLSSVRLMCQICFFFLSFPLRKKFFFLPLPLLLLACFFLLPCCLKAMNNIIQGSSEGKWEDYLRLNYVGKDLVKQKMEGERGELLR